MAALPASRFTRASFNPRTPDLVFPFLAPSIQCPQPASRGPVACFSTSPALWKRDNNKNRGLSILRSTGLRKRQTLSVKRWLKEIPKPVTLQKPLTGDEEHGLWEFFHEKKSLRTPDEMQQHGRAWTVAELRIRTWNDLHNLWWICHKERNRLATEKIERARLETGYGDREAEKRDETVKATMDAIRETLIERQKAWEDARKLAEDDPEIDLNSPDGRSADLLNNDLYELDELEAAEEDQAQAPKEKAEAAVETEKVQKEEPPKDKQTNPA